MIALDVLRFGNARMSVGDLNGLPMLALTRTPSDELALAAKRVFDVAVSSMVLLLLSPVFLALAAAIKFDSRGPVFFKQKRVGLQGRTFEHPEVPEHVHGRRGPPRVAARPQRDERAGLQDEERPAHHPRAAASSAGPRSTSSPSSGTCCAAR